MSIREENRQLAREMRVVSGAMLMKNSFEESLSRLTAYCEKEEFKGYDPYDTLNTWLPIHVFGKWGMLLATQFQKYNPLNIRPLLGIKKDFNPKGMGLFLEAYCSEYKRTGEKAFLDNAKTIYSWLLANHSRGFSGMAWGYNFPWASSEEYKASFLPSVVVTAQVVEGVSSYYDLTNEETAKNAVLSAADYVNFDIPVIEHNEGLSFAYTNQSSVACYNASLHAAEILLKACLLEGKAPDGRVKRAVEFVLSRQKENGSWYYSFNPKTKTERMQIDFHQGFVLVSLHNLMKQGCFLKEEISKAIIRGLEFYKNNQFTPQGRSLWRLPARWPVDIHNQSQGIITFSRLQEYHKDYKSFAETIAHWTINNMQHANGFFFYQKYPIFTNKIPFIRWSQAWMMLALSELLSGEQSC